MIEKLSEFKITRRDGPFINVECNTKIINTLIRKINQLADAVNKLQEQYDNVCVWVGEQKLNYNPDTTKGLSTLVEEPEPADPYAEQRKWIGKLCWFWDIQEEYKFVGILGEIADNGTYFQKAGIVSYLNCEPVKPDDDIIYKGE